MKSSKNLKISHYYLILVIIVFASLALTEEGSLREEIFLIDDTPPDVLFFKPLVTASLKGGDNLENMTCSSDDECASINGSLCENNLCVCPQDKPIFVNATVSLNTSFCLEALNLTAENCSFSQQCNYPHGLCSQKKCTCAVGYKAIDKNCIQIKRNSLIPIIVGSAIGIAVIGTLGAYCWMSRKK